MPAGGGGQSLGEVPTGQREWGARCKGSREKSSELHVGWGVGSPVDAGGPQGEGMV